MVVRLLAGLGAMGVERVLTLRDRTGIATLLLRALDTHRAVAPHERWPQVEFVDLPIDRAALPARESVRGRQGARHARPERTRHVACVHRRRVAARAHDRSAVYTHSRNTANLPGYLSGRRHTRGGPVRRAAHLLPIPAPPRAPPPFPRAPMRPPPASRSCVVPRNSTFVRAQQWRCLAPGALRDTRLPLGTGRDGLRKPHLTRTYHATPIPSRVPPVL